MFLIDQAVNDYEEDNVQYGEESVGKITARSEHPQNYAECTHYKTHYNTQAITGKIKKLIPTSYYKTWHRPAYAALLPTQYNTLLCSLHNSTVTVHWHWH